MNKLEQFLIDNKGCPLTTIAIKQLLVKFIESLSDEGLGELIDLAKPENVNKVIGVNLAGELTAFYPSSLDLLGSTTLSFTSGDPGNIQAIFNLSTSALVKITNKTILVFTYGNCFVLGMIGQTGEGRVCGNLVYDNAGNSSLCKIKFNLSGTTMSVVTNLAQAFPSGTIPTAYLYAFTVK